MNRRPHRRAFLRERWNRLRATADTGFTLIEVVVATSIMAASMSMFTAGIIQIYGYMNRADATANAQSQVHVTFLRLEKEIRYASGFSTPGLVGADSYVEYLSTSTGNPVCTELRLNVATAQLQRRTWTQGSQPSAGWTALASGVSSAQPFTVTAADATFNFQRLTVNLLFSAGAGGSATSTQTDVTFTAVNTSLGTSSPTVCTEGRPL